MILKKIGEEYKLYAEDDSCVATTQESPYKRLSKQNCDEIFGVVDVEKLAQMDIHNVKPINPHPHSYFSGFIRGFNKAMELNKDKLFTIEDMYEAIRKAKSYDEIPNHDGVIVSFDYSKEEIIQSLQQPTEIEVKIEMELVSDGLDEMAQLQHKRVPKLDENGCLILRKK